MSDAHNEFDCTKSDQSPGGIWSCLGLVGLSCHGIFLKQGKFFVRSLHYKHRNILFKMSGKISSLLARSGA